MDSLHEAADYLAVANILCRQYLYKVFKNDPTKVR